MPSIETVNLAHGGIQQCYPGAAVYVVPLSGPELPQVRWGLGLGVATGWVEVYQALFEVAPCLCGWWWQLQLGGGPSQGVGLLFSITLGNAHTLCWISAHCKVVLRATGRWHAVRDTCATLS